VKRGYLPSRVEFTSLSLDALTGAFVRKTGLFNGKPNGATFQGVPSFTLLKIKGSKRWSSLPFVEKFSPKIPLKWYALTLHITYYFQNKFSQLMGKKF